MVRALHYRPKTCIACKREFTPRSGVQLTFSELCKAEARAKGLSIRRRKIKGSLGAHDIKAEVARVLDGGVLGELQERDTLKAESPATQPPKSGHHKLELDLSPLTEYVRTVVRKEIKEAVEEFLREQFKAVLG